MRISDWSSDVCSSDLGQYTPYASESPLSLPFRIGGKRSSQDQTQLHRDRSPMSASIALVDDDRNILTSVTIGLQAEGFQTRLYTDGETGRWEEHTHELQSLVSKWYAVTRVNKK